MTDKIQDIIDDIGRLAMSHYFEAKKRDVFYEPIYNMAIRVLDQCISICQKHQEKS